MLKCNVPRTMRINLPPVLLRATRGCVLIARRALPWPCEWLWPTSLVWKTILLPPGKAAHAHNASSVLRAQLGGNAVPLSRSAVRQIQQFTICCCSSACCVCVFLFLFLYVISPERNMFVKYNYTTTTAATTKTAKHQHNYCLGKLIAFAGDLNDNSMCVCVCVCVITPVGTNFFNIYFK